MGKYNKDLYILKKIVSYCEQIETATQHFNGTIDIFKRDTTYRNACCMCLMQIGELAPRLSDTFRITHTQMPWKTIKEMRNVFAHDYINIDLGETWKVIEFRVPELKSFCQNIIFNV